MQTVEDVARWIDSNIEAQQSRQDARHRFARNVLVVAGSLAAIWLALFAFLVADAFASGDAANTPETPATDYHGLPGNNPGHSDEQVGAAPAGTAPNADGGLHNIAAVQANGGFDDEPPACDAHGGLGAANKNCVDD